MMSAESYASILIPEDRLKQLESKYSPPALNTSFDNVLIIDQLPRVDDTKVDKLVTVLKKTIFNTGHGIIPGSDSIYMPKGPDGLTKGYMFVEFETKEQAESVLKVAHNHRLDKQHILYAFRFTDFDRLAKLDEEGGFVQNQEDELAGFIEPSIEPFVERDFLHGWLLDEQLRDQFLTWSGNTVSIAWANRTSDQGVPKPIQQRPQWTDHGVSWSPYGTYLATIHTPGVALWGGEQFVRLVRFSHPGARGVSFSPDERYCVTVSPESTEPNVLLWDVLTGKLVKGFHHRVATPEEAAQFTPFRWSMDGKICVRLLDDLVQVWDTSFSGPESKLPDLTITGVRDAQFCTSQSHARWLAYWVPETANIPARVAIIDLTTRSPVRSKNLFGVLGVRINWSPTGSYLAVLVDRQVSKKALTGVTSAAASAASHSTNLELFRVLDKGCPVDVVEFADQPVALFAWEPYSPLLSSHGSISCRFAISQNFSTGTSQIQFYDAAKPTEPLIKKPLERKTVTKLAWSPKSPDMLMLASLGISAATIEIYMPGEQSTLITREHYQATDAEWDPSGLLFTSWVAWNKHSGSDNGFIIWNARGEQLAKVAQPRFMSFMWRPRPRTLLSSEQVKEIRRNYRALAARFEAIDAQSASQSSNEQAAQAALRLASWHAFRAKFRSHDKLHKKHHTTQHAVKVTEWVEELVDETLEIISDDEQLETEE